MDVEKKRSILSVCLFEFDIFNDTVLLGKSKMMRMQVINQKFQLMSSPSDPPNIGVVKMCLPARTML